MNKTLKHILIALVCALVPGGLAALVYFKWDDIAEMFGSEETPTNPTVDVLEGNKTENSPAIKTTPTANTTQKKSNTEVAFDVLQGKYGNGDERRAKLEAEGYDYYEIQKIVNAMS